MARDKIRGVNIFKRKPPYIRDVYLAKIIEGARFTDDGYPIIEKWMVATEPPKELSQWNCRSKVNNPSTTGMSFYCTDQYFQPVISNPDLYLDKLSKYQVVIGLDASPYDNMPPIVQCSQIYVNLAVTYYYGRQGIKIIPNVRLGHVKTYSSLDAYPKETLISIGTNGFVNDKNNRKIFEEQLRIIIDKLNPSGIIVYGTIPEDIFSYAKEKEIPLYVYESFIHSRRSKKHEGK